MSTDFSSNEKAARNWAMALHLSQFASKIIPLAGIVAPIVIWQMKKDEFPVLDAHGKNVLNWMISELIYTFVCFLLMFVVIGIFLLPIVLIVGAVFAIIGAIKASNGEVWKYPLTIEILK